MAVRSPCQIQRQPSESYIYETAVASLGPGNTGNYSATPKYDETTGLGTPVGQNLIPALAAQ